MSDEKKNERVYIRMPGDNPPKPLFWRIFNAITLFRIGVANFIFLLIVFLIVQGLFFFSPKSFSTGPVLYIPLSGLLKEESVVDDYWKSTLKNSQDTIVFQVTKALQIASNDDNITAAFMDFSGLKGGSLAQGEEIAVAMNSFRSTGKKIFAFSNTYSQLDLLMASCADEVYIDPFGSVILKGFDHYNLFLKNFSEKWGVDFNVLKVGLFKGGAEGYSQSQMSEELKGQLLYYLKDLRASYGKAIESNRALEPGDMGRYINGYLNLLEKNQGDGAQTALKFGWVDGILPQRQLWLDKGFIEKPSDSESKMFYHFNDYLLAHKRSLPHSKVAVLTLSGPIGSGQNTAASPEILIPLLDEAAKRKDIVALILRIDSGGGDVWASEEIRRGIERFRSTDRPVIASFGGTAASGAYWIATACNAMVASPYTVTGSIGVYGLHMNFNRFLSQYLGISVDGVQTDTLALTENPLLPLSERGKAVRQWELKDIYNRFLGYVSQSRGLTIEETNKLAQGKVYTGAQAYELGLVDQLGGFSDAISLALKEAQWHGDRYAVEFLSQTLSFSESLLAHTSVPLSQLNQLRQEVFQECLFPSENRGPALLFFPVDTLEVEPRKGEME